MFLSATSQGVDRVVDIGRSAHALDPINSLILAVDTRIYAVAILQLPKIVDGARSYQLEASGFAKITLGMHNSEGAVRTVNVCRGYYDSAGLRS